MIAATDAALADIDFTAEDLAVDCGVHVANMFLMPVEETVKKIATMPLGFPLVDPPIAHSPDLRVVPVFKFAARLVVYQPTDTDTGIVVVRVLRASNDWHDAFLNAEPRPVRVGSAKSAHFPSGLVAVRSSLPASCSPRRCV